MRDLAWLLLAVILVQGASAQYYADVTLDVRENGAVMINGISNHPLLQQGETQEFTSKRGPYWMLNLTITEQLEEFVIRIQLPPGASLNFVSARSSVSISSHLERVVITRIGSNSSVSLAAQYELANEQQQSQVSSTPYYLGGAALLLLLASIAYMVLAKRMVKRPRLQFREGLPERQRQILGLLERSGGKLTQKQIEEALRLPKSSVSRNIDALSRKGLVSKQVQGLTNTIRLISE
jgi:uncharacterized membrane protein